MIPQPRLLIEKITQELQGFCDLAVVAMSGGADSTLVATLCCQALGADRVHSLHLPATDYDSQKFNANSLSVATQLGIHRHMIPIGDLATAAGKSLADVVSAPLSKVTLGNTRARLRMMMTYALANHLSETTGQRVRVIGTGNLSEDYIGYDTKGGDALADIFPIGELFKSEVYQMLEFFRDENIIAEHHIDRIPSAGLWDQQTDEGELGYSYAQMEGAIRQFWGKADTEVNPQGALETFVWQRHLNHRHKHLAPPVIALRSMCR
jgi:NAD+ synthase